MKRLLLYILLLYSIFSFAQEFREIQKLDSLENLLNKVISNNKIEDQVVLKYQIFRLYLNEINDYAIAFKLAKDLEPIIENNINRKDVITIAPVFYSGLAWLYHGQSKYETSIEYYKKAIAYSKQLNMIKYAFGLNGSLAFNYFLIDKKEKAYSLMDSLINVAYSLNDPELKAQSHYNFYTILGSENPEEALFHAKKSLITNNKKDLAHRYINVGTCFTNLKKYDSALFYTIKGKEIALENNYTQQEANAYNQLRNIYTETEDFENALFYTNAFNTLDRKLISYDSAINIVKSQDQSMALEKELNEEKLRHQKTVKWVSIILTIVLILALFYNHNQIKLIKRQKELIAKEKEKAEASEKLKEQFLANMSHEIRTPMHAISGMTNSLLRNPHPKKQDSYLEAMKTSSDNLLVLLNDILDLSKIESGKLEIEDAIINPNDIINNIVKIFNHRATDKGLKLETQIDKNVPKELIGDPNRLTQILTNLVGNALKFTEEGEILIKVFTSENNSIINYQVIDTGIGIEKDKLESIFNIFEQGQQSKSQIFGGSGLGLSISKKLVELQNGVIWVKSKLGKGSTFTFKLPLRIPESSSFSKALVTDDDIKITGELLQGLKILLVEDDDFNIMVVQDDLDYFIKDYSLTVTRNGKEAIEKYTEEIFDIILMDLHMPVLNGIEATQRIREIETENSEKKPTPIIAMTANIVKSEIEKCFEVGMNDYIPKPYKSEQLITKLLEYKP